MLIIHPLQLVVEGTLNHFSVTSTTLMILNGDSPHPSSCKIVHTCNWIATH